MYLFLENDFVVRHHVKLMGESFLQVVMSGRSLVGDKCWLNVFSENIEMICNVIIIHGLMHYDTYDISLFTFYQNVFK